ncbi:MAG TPA: maleylpyruvate isomerase family mycothiol-dependent enzyme [Pseudonocardiaceae bacterium]
MRVSDFLAELRDQGALMSAAACAAALTDPVPTCPGWTVRELLLHTGGVHRWATTIVGERRQEPVPLRPPETVPDPATWFATGHAALLRTLEAAGPLVCWTFQPAADPLLFWARRQAHETTIHRVDAELAAGLARTAIKPEFAADGVDELLTGFLPRNRRWRRETERFLGVHATDVNRDWTVRIGPEAPRPAAGPADAVISGPAEALYLALWNRRPLTGITGDASLLADWSTAVRVR